MANPSLVNLTADTWTIVATNTATGQVHFHRTGSARLYLVTYRETGGSAPTDNDDPSANPIIFAAEPRSAITPPLISADIRHPTALDVYVKSVGGVGKVVVEL